MKFSYQNNTLVGLLLVLLLLVSAFTSVGVGAYDLSADVFYKALLGRGEQIENYLIWQVRLPRLLLAIVVGGGLAITGAAVQGLFRNPLAEPTFIGVTSGAMLFAVIALVFCFTLFPWMHTDFQQLAVSLGAFLGALLTTWLVYKIAVSGGGSVDVSTMLLAGIAITSLAGAFTGLIIYYSDEDQLRDITFWTLGSLAGASWLQVALCAPICLIGSYFLQRDALALNAFLLGEREANQLGFSIQKIKQRIIAWTALIVGVCISMTGLIGFVGLVIPHLLRLRLGTDYRKLLRFSFLLGASFLVFADSVARTIVAPAELPIGILTALVGAPFFIWLLIRSRQRKYKVL
ncbi:MAG: iron ABC transporter permease [Bacteroidota bacterium]